MGNVRNQARNSLPRPPAAFAGRHKDFTKFGMQNFSLWAPVSRYFVPRKRESIKSILLLEVLGFVEGLKDFYKVSMRWIENVVILK